MHPPQPGMRESPQYANVTVFPVVGSELADPNSDSPGPALISSATTGLGRDDDDEAALSVLF